MKNSLMALLLAAALCFPALVVGQQKASTQDDRIIDQVRMKLAGDPDVKGGALDVTVKDGVVTIKGRVDTEKGRERATKLAKKVKGVKDVDNELVEWSNIVWQSARHRISALGCWQSALDHPKLRVATNCGLPAAGA